MRRPIFRFHWDDANNCPGLTPLWWRIWGVLILPLFLWRVACWDRTAGWRMDGSLEPLRYRLSVAWVIWQARYWCDWWSKSTPPRGGEEGE